MARQRRKKHNLDKGEKGEPSADMSGLLPPCQQERLLPLHKMHDDRFEHLCVDLAEFEKGVIRAELKRTQGVKQFGVDVEGFDEVQCPGLVISCKRWLNATPGNFKDWSDDFLGCWDGHWSGQGVKKFVLAVTVELNDDRLNSAIREEAARFAAIGVRYEVWGLQSLTGRLKTRPNLIPNYFHAAWRDAIAGLASDTTSCGVASTASAPPPVVGVELLSVDAEKQIAASFGVEVAQGLESALERFREGRHGPLTALVERLKRDLAGFDALDHGTKAKILRAEAALSLSRNDIQTASRTLQQARYFHAPPDRVGEAQLLYAQGQGREAILLMETPANQREWEFLLALILELDGSDAMLARLDQDGDFECTADIYRLCAIAHSLKGNDAQALLNIDEAMRLTPTAFGILFASAVIRFTASLSPRALRQFATIPNPIHPGLARNDDAAIRFRREALAILDRLLAICDHAADDLSLWKIAVLICGKDTVQKGIALLADAIRQANPLPGAVIWALACGIKFNHSKVNRSLGTLLDANRANSRHLAALLAMRAANDQGRQALQDLQRYGARFSTPGDTELVAHWRHQLSGSDRDASAFRAAMRALHTAQNPAPLIELLRQPLADGEQVVAAAESLVYGGFAEHADVLRDQLLALQTADAIELAANAAFAHRDFSGTLEILAQASIFYPHGVLPHRLRALQIDAHLNSGQVGRAVRALESMNQTGTEDASMLLQIAALRLGVGDIIGARRLLRTFSPTTPLSSRETFPLAYQLRREDPDIARRLLESTDPADLQANALAAYSLANEVRSDAVAGMVAPDFQRLANDGEKHGVILLNGIEAVLEMLRGRQQAIEHHRVIWLQGQVPMHLALHQDGYNFLAAAYGRPDADDAWDDQWPMVLRAGIARGPAPIIGAETRIRLDITSTILAQRLGILHLIEKLAPVRVPSHLPQALTQLIETISTNVSTVAAAIRAVLERIERDELRTFIISTDDRACVSIPDDGDSLLDQPFTSLATLLRASELPAVCNWLAPYQATIAPDALAQHTKFEISESDAVRLERAGILGAALAAADIRISAAETELLRRHFVVCQSDCERLQVLTAARETVADRLLGETWEQIVWYPATEEEQKHFDQAGPIICSLLALAKEDGIADTVTWVEDRVVSATARIGSGARIDVLAILDALRDGDHMSPLQHSDVLGRLRTFGYGFLPYDTDAIADMVLTAPIRDGRLCETAKLTNIRRHYALQFSRLRHINPAIQAPGPDGAQAEVRFGAHHMHLAEKILPPLWSDEAASYDDISLRANWIWQNLHADQASFIPLGGSPGEEARRTLVRASIAGLITSAFMIQKPIFRAERTARGRYLDWIFGRIVDQFNRFNADLVSDAIKSVAEMLASIVVEQDTPNYPGLARASRVMVLRFLDAVPEPWRTRLSNEEPLSQRLNLDLGLQVSLHRGPSYPIAEFYGAIAAAFRGERAQAKATTGESVTFAVEDGRITVDLSPTAKISLADEDLGLCQPEEERRSAVFHHMAGELDFSDGDISRFWEEFESQPDIGRRFERLHQLQTESYAWRLHRLLNELHGDRQFDFDLLAPPSPGSMLRYLQLGPNTNAANIATAFTGIASRLGALEALKRTAGLPIPYDRSTNDALADTLAKTEPSAGIGRAPSPLYALRVAIAQASADDAAMEAAVGELLSALDTLGDLFLAVLRWAARQALHTPAWREISPDLRRALVWLHADIITAHLVVGAADPEPTVELIDDLEKSGVWRLLNHEGEEIEAIVGFDTAIGFRAWALSLVGAALGERAISEDIRTQMRSSIALANGDSWGPHVVLIARPNVPPFWAPQGTVAALRDCGIYMSDTISDSSTREQLLDRLILEADLPDGIAVAAALPFFLIRDIPAERICDVLRIAKAFDPFTRFPLATPAHELWLQIMASLYARSGDEPAYTAMLRHAVGSAKEQAGNSRKAVFEALANSVFVFALHWQGDQQARLQKILFGFDVIAQETPDMRQKVRSTLATLVTQVPPEEAAPLWDVLIRWRSAP